MNDGSSAAVAPLPPGQRADVLEVRDVTVRFGGLTALDAVSLTAAPRQVTGIIGPNGAGKTTLLNVLCGFVRPHSGGVNLGGTSLTGLPPHRLASLGIARTLQGVGLFQGLTVLENVMAGATCQARAGFWPALLGLARCGSGRWPRSTGSGWPTRPAAGPISWPMACASGSRSPARS
jgi:ABC-type branched-subunit amino acid transport system ATPase component